MSAQDNTKTGKKYVLTGVNGHLGGHAAAFALQIAQPNDQLVFATHNLEKLPADKVKEWKAKGVQVEEADYDNVEQMVKVFQGAEAVAFISTWMFMARRQQAKNVCEAAKKAGVKRVCYTSTVGADSTLPEEEMLFLPRDHRAIEKTIKESGLEYSIQRNNLYQENLLLAILLGNLWQFCGDRWLNNSHGVPGAYVACEDCGNVLAALLLGKGKPNTIYEVTGPEAVTDLEIFCFLREKTGMKAQFVDMLDEDYRQWWTDKGMPSVKDNKPPNFALPLPLYLEDLACCGEIVASGAMRHASNDVELLTGRKPRSYRDLFMQFAAMMPPKH